MNKILNIFSYFVIAEIFLTIVFERLPFPFYSYIFWQLGWFVLLIFFKPRIFTSKIMSVSYVGLVYYAFQHFVLNKPELNSFNFFEYFISIASALSLFTYMLMNN